MFILTELLRWVKFTIFKVFIAFILPVVAHSCSKQSYVYWYTEVSSRIILVGFILDFLKRLPTDSLWPTVWNWTISNIIWPMSNNYLRKWSVAPSNCLLLPQLQESSLEKIKRQIPFQLTQSTRFTMSQWTMQSLHYLLVFCGFFLMTSRK